MSKTELTGMFVDVENGSRLEWEYNPESFHDSGSTEYARVGIPGMSHPRIHFTGGNDRTLSFVLRFHNSRNKDVKAAVRQLEAWRFPEYRKGKLFKPPHLLLVQFGDVWEGDKWVLTSVGTTYLRFDKEGVPVYAESAVELLEHTETSKGMKEVMGR